jgi:S-disulfanyl-L-cysteine oxidoreductase SoxD
VAPGATGQRILIAGFLVFVVAALAIVVIRTNRSDPTSAVVAGQSNAELVERGRQLYSTACASCHGEDLQGDPGWPQPLANGTRPASPLDARSQATEHDDEWIFRTIAEGGQATAAPGEISTMPAFGSTMTETQIWAMIAYIKSTWPPEVQQKQSEKS